MFTTQHPRTSSTSASLSPVSPPDNIFALPTEVFSSCLAIVLAVMVGGLFLWPAVRYRTGYQTVWEIRPSAETPSSVHWRRFYFQLTHVHSALELSGRCALQIYLLTYLLTYYWFSVLVAVMLSQRHCWGTLHNETGKTRIDVELLIWRHRLSQISCHRGLNYVLRFNRWLVGHVGRIMVR